MVFRVGVKVVGRVFRSLDARVMRNQFVWLTDVWLSGKSPLFLFIAGNGRIGI